MVNKTRETFDPFIRKANQKQQRREMRRLFYIMFFLAAIICGTFIAVLTTSLGVK